MSKKRFVLVVLSLVLTFTMSGCLDLLSVPGVATSPDSSKIYFLGLVTTFDTDDTQENAFPMTAFDLNTNQATVFGEAIGAFAVNPVNGEIAYNAVSAVEDTTSFMIIDAAGNSRVLLPTEALPGRLVATQMKYSPDGSQLALTAVTIPLEIDLDSFDADESGEELAPEVLDLLQSGLYLIDVNAATITLVSDTTTQWANTLDWSPNGQYIAYNVWVDTNANGNIDTTGGLSALSDDPTVPVPVADLSQIQLYNTTDGSTTPIASTQLDYNPTFISDTRLAYLSANVSSIAQSGSGISIAVYDIATSTSQPVYTTEGFISGMALSNKQDQVAWTQMPFNEATETTGEEESDNPPAEIYVSDLTFSAPRLVAQVPNEFALVDAPVWIKDDSGVFITSTNIFASLVTAFITAFTEAFSGLAEELGGTPAPEEVEETPVQTLTYVNVSDGTATVLYEGTMSNSAFISSVFSLANSEATAAETE